MEVTANDARTNEVDHPEDGGAASVGGLGGALHAVPFWPLLLPACAPSAS